ncbi:MAG: hypothetical protein HYR60_26890 [Acidobacteria bacterium]|nr:hypothetical protein [Acidobacteriota bacterium]
MRSGVFRIALIVLCGGLAYAWWQTHDAQPGRARPDAPAQHEVARRNLRFDETTERFMNPRQAEPEPPADTRITSAMRMTDDTRSDDFPDIASNPKDRSEVWCVWLSYSGRQDRLHLARYNPAAQNWGAWNLVPGSTGDVWRPKLAFDAGGRVWVIWSQQRDGNFDLYARWYDRANWGPLERLTSAPQADFDHRVATDSQGHIWIAWQGFREGQSDIFLAHYDGQKWSPEIKVSDSLRNDWEPAIAVDSSGAVAIAWDTYDQGNYDVRLRTYAGGKLGPVMAVADTPRLEARPTLAYDKQDRLWIAYEAGPTGWGKDQGQLIPEQKAPGTKLLDDRHVEVVCYSGTTRLGMAPELSAKLPRRAAKVYVPASPAIFQDGQIFVDDAGRVHLLFRSQAGSAFATYWRESISTLTADGWTDPAPLPYSVGRVSMRAAATPAAGADLWLAWPRDNDPRFSIFINLPEETLIENVYTGRYSSGVPVSEPKLEARRPEVKPRPPGHPDEDARVAAIRAVRARTPAGPLRILRGDVHRHTEMSPDLRGMPDGSILDFYRYMMDAAAMDFGMISDHQAGGDREYWWWLIEKTADLFHAPPNYVTLYGYERSVTYPNGHRNIVHTRRGYMPVPFFQAPDSGIRSHNAGRDVIAGDTKALYEEIRRSGGISIPHTTATTMGTDWRDNDKLLEPVVEIFQGDRFSYECAGCPLSDDGRPGLSPLQAPRPLGMVQNAWAKGYRLGVIASSDHLSTHMSYALVYASALTREAIQTALRRRHTYASTDNIILDYRLGEHFMGEEFEAASVPPLYARISGTAPIEDLGVVRNNQVIYQISPKSAVAEVRYQDRTPPRGWNYYYVRAVQQDRQAVWSSPIWVKVK